MKKFKLNAILSNPSQLSAMKYGLLDHGLFLSLILLKPKSPELMNVEIENKKKIFKCSYHISSFLPFDLVMTAKKFLPSVFIYNAMISSCSRARDHVAASDFYHRLIRNGLTPDRC